jgi:hypothetical protein
MTNPVDPILKMQADVQLQNIALKADLDNLAATLNDLFQVKVPELKTITTPEELQTLIAAVRRGTASNEQLTKFIGIANAILSKI